MVNTLIKSLVLSSMALISCLTFCRWTPWACRPAEGPLPLAAPAQHRPLPAEADTISSHSPNNSHTQCDSNSCSSNCFITSNARCSKDSGAATLGSSWSPDFNFLSWQPLSKKLFKPKILDRRRTFFPARLMLENPSKLNFYKFYQFKFLHKQLSVLVWKLSPMLHLWWSSTTLLRQNCKIFFLLSMNQIYK